MKYEQLTYETPSIEMMEMHVEGVIAASLTESNFFDATPGDDLDYESIW
jgi:hypothetical protein